MSQKNNEVKRIYTIVKTNNKDIAETYKNHIAFRE
jgi:hypothetical protein